MATVSVICPSLKCRKTLQVPEHTRGQLVRCKHCGTTFAVPKARPRAPAPQK
ncbi:MAG: hypothetical protein ACE5F9_05805 [Phycisphaerae bacterium]